MNEILFRKFSPISGRVRSFYRYRIITGTPWMEVTKWWVEGDQIHGSVEMRGTGQGEISMDLPYSPPPCGQKVE